MIAFQTIADLDPHAPFVGSDQQQHAVVASRIADAPVAAELVAVFLDLVAIEAWDSGDHELALVRLLELVELLGQLRFGRVIDDVRLVHHGRGAALGKVEGWAAARLAAATAPRRR